MRFVLLAAALVLAPLGALPALAQTAPAISTDPATAPAGLYRLDPGHASVTWRVSHLGMSMYTARFDRVSADLTFNPTDLAASSVTVVIDAASVSTGHRNADGEAAFDTKVANEALRAATNPQIRFQSTAVVRTGPTTGQITGDLTLNGQTRPVTLEASFYGHRANIFTGRHMMGFSARTTIKRSEWGVANWAGPVGDDVEIIVDRKSVV